ncbi:MAG: tetratricopeptide repeat protein [Planctomycetes bacterium]|nr:tetratricopeptide repeat protein [Planctomycetota bacterium]
MNKEQVAFIIALCLLGLMHFSAGSEERPRRRSRRLPDRDIEQQEALKSSGHFLGAEDYAWDGSGAGRNFFLAPRETSDLPLAPLLPPPPPRLPTPGLPLVFRIGGTARSSLRHALLPEPIDLSGSASSTFAAPDPVGDTGDDPASEDAEDPLDRLTDSFAGAMSLADQLKQSTAERLEAERRTVAAKQEERERRKTLDQVHWPSGDVSYGLVKTLGSEDDRFDIKLTIDRIRGDSSLSEDDKKKQLDKIRLVFFEDKGRDRKKSRIPLTGVNVQQIRFAPSDVLNKFHLSKRQMAKDDKDGWWSLATLVYKRDGVTPEQLGVVTEHLEEMLGAEMGGEQVYGMLADCYRRLYHYDKELKILEEALSREPLMGSVALLARYGQVCLRLKLRTNAEKAFAKALSTDAGNALARMGRGEALLQQGKAGEALVHLRQAQTGVGLDADQKRRVWNLLGEAYLAKGNLKPARQSFQTAINITPDDRDATAGLAVVTFLEVGPAAAKSMVDRGRAAHPLDGRLAYLDGVCLLRTGEYVEAMKVLTLTMDLDPLLSAHARTGLSYLNEKAGQDEAALGEADQALVADPLSVGARLQRARCLLNVGDYGAAKDEYLRVLSADPGRVDVLVALGDASFLAGNSIDASRYYSRAFAADPGFPDLLARRLVCDVRRRARNAADDHVRRIDAALLRQPFVQAAMAYYHYDRGKPQETLQLLKRLADKKVGYPELLSYAKQIVGQVSENLNKERWRDDFNRSGSQILLGWEKEVGAGPNVSLSKERVLFSGKQRRQSGEPTVLHQERSGRLFQSFSVELHMKPGVGTYKGIGVLAFQRMSRPPEPYEGVQRRDGGNYPYYGAQVGLSPDGKLQFRFLDKGRMSEWADLPGAVMNGDSVTIEIEVVDPKKNRYRVNIDGAPVAPVDIPGLGRWARTLELQIFGQAALDRELAFSADNATIITRKNR